MTKRTRLSILPAALCIGGYSGWVLTVMYICERSLHYYRDDSMLDSVNITFLYMMTGALAVSVVILLLLDIEGILSNKLLRLMPGVFMMESGIALSVANANSLKVFSAFAGVAAAFGMLAALSQLLRIKVGRRMRTIGLGLMLGAGARLAAVRIITSYSQKYFIWVAVGIGVITALTVHSNGFSSEAAPLVSRAEAAPSVILRKLPAAYIWLFILCVCFWLASTTIEKTGRAMLPAGMESSEYELYAYSGWLAAALIVSLTVSLSRLPMLFVCASGMAAASGFLAQLPHFTADETKIFAALCFAASASHKAFVLLFIIVFSLDRPHPLFYAVTGYAVSAAGELAGNLIRVYHPVSIGRLVYMLLIIMPIGGAVLVRIMSRSGLSKASFDRRHIMGSLINRKAAELELFDREKMMVKCVVLDGYNVDELASKLIFSRNTVKALMRPVLGKFGVADLAELRDYFEKLTTEAENRQERSQEEDAAHRTERRIAGVSSIISAWRQYLYKRDAIKEQKEKDKAKKRTKAGSPRKARNGARPGKTGHGGHAENSRAEGYEAPAETEGPYSDILAELGISGDDADIDTDGDADGDTDGDAVGSYDEYFDEHGGSEDILPPYDEHPRDTETDL